MRQLIQHRLRTNIIGRTGSVMKRGQYVNNALLDQTLRAIAGWTGEENCGLVTFQGAQVTNEGENVTHNP